jgi:hypothetical protein
VRLRLLTAPETQLQAAKGERMHVPRGQAGARALLAGLVLSGLCAVLLVSLHAVPAPHGYFALRSESLVSLPMDTMMRELHGMPSDILPGATEKLSSSGQSSSSGGVHSMLHDDAPLPSDPYDGVNNLVSVKDTTGRTLTPEAISASGLSDDGDLSDNDLAVLEAAGTLKPRVAKLHRGGELPPYIEVAQRAAIRDAENGEDDSNFLDATPGEIVTIRDTRVDPRVQARKAKKVLDSLNSGYAQSMQKWLTGSDKVGDVLTAIDSRSASYLANTGDMGKAIDAQTEKAILDTADKQHYHEKKGLVQSEAEEGEIPQEARDVVGKDRQGQDRDGVQNLNAMLEAEKKVPSDGPDPSDEGVVHTPDGFVLRIDPKAAGKSSPMRPLSAKAHLAMLAARPARVESLLPIDPTRHRHDTNAAARHDGYDEPTGPNKDFQVHAVPELGDFRDKMEWQKHPFERQPAEDKEYWKTSEDEYPPQDATMVFGAGRLRRESKTQAVHNPYGWLGARGAEVPVTTADSEDTLTGGIAGGYVDGAGVSTRSSLESGSKLCQLVNCYNRGAIPMPPAARVRQQGLRMQALSEERKRPFLGDEIFDLGVDNGYNNGDVIMDPESDEGDANLRGMYYGPITARKQRRMQALSEERKRPFLGDEIFDLGVDNGYNNGDVIMDPESDEGDANLRGMYYGPITARKQRRMALAFWGQGNRFLRAAEPRQDRALMQVLCEADRDSTHHVACCMLAARMLSCLVCIAYPNVVSTVLMRLTEVYQTRDSPAGLIYGSCSQSPLHRARGCRCLRITMKGARYPSQRCRPGISLRRLIRSKMTARTRTTSS